MAQCQQKFAIICDAKETSVTIALLLFKQVFLQKGSLGQQP